MTRLLAVVAAAALLPGLAWAHAGFQVPVPRDTNVQSGTSIKNGPCGPNAPGSGVRTPLTPGAPFTIEFIETINHPGYFRVFFSEVGDTNYVLLEDRIPHSNAAPSPSFANPRRYTATITVPNVTCANCSLQLIQVMEDRNPPTLYFSCADISIGTVTPMPDAGVPLPPDAEPEDAAAEDAQAEPDAGVAPDADPVVNDDAAALPPAPDATVTPPAPDATVAAANDAAAPTGAAPTRNGLGGGCATTSGGGDLATIAVLSLLGWARLRRREH